MSVVGFSMPVFVFPFEHVHILNKCHLAASFVHNQET